MITDHQFPEMHTSNQHFPELALERDVKELTGRMRLIWRTRPHDPQTTKEENRELGFLL